MVEQYEQLRAMATGSAAAVCARGLALLLRGGMVSWMQAWSALAPEPKPATKPNQRPYPCLVNARPEVVPLLAQMVISAMKESTT